MLPSKNILKGGSTRSGSRSASQTQDLAARVSSAQPCDSTFSLHGEEFPPLGKVDTCPSSAASSSINPQGASRSKGSFSGIQAKNTPLRSYVPSTSSKSSLSSRQIHDSAQQEDEWLISADEEDRLQQKLSSKNIKKGPLRKNAGDVAKDESGTPASQDRLYFLGRLLTSILRHKASYLKLQMRDDGYVAVNDLLKLGIRTRPGVPLKAYTVDDILKAVERDGKQRFTLLTEDDVLLIRANQGHSIKSIESDKLLKPIFSADEIPVCVHGTLMRNLTLIMKFGLKKMGRNHVHFASGLPKEDGVISGMRHYSEVLIYLDVQKALQDGMKLYMSANGVILTEGYDGVVPPDYFERVASWDNGKITPLSLKAKR